MTRSNLAVFSLLALVLSPRPAATQETSREDDVRAAVTAFGRAFVQADVSSLKRVLANDYSHVNGRSGGVLNRDEWLTFIQSRRANLDSGKLVISSYNVEDVRVRLYGETAVVTGVVESSGQREGVPFSSRVRFTNVWVLQGGAWRRAAFHDSPLPEPGS